MKLWMNLKNCEYALQNNVDILIFPFMFVGYNEYENLLRRPEILKINLDCLNFIKNQVDDRICVVFGHYDFYEGRIIDCVSAVSNHEFILTTREINTPVLFEYKGHNIAVLNFEDELLFKGFDREFSTCFRKSQYLLIPSKSCFTKEKKITFKTFFFEKVAVENNIEVAYANLYGVHDLLCLMV